MLLLHWYNCDVRYSSLILLEIKIKGLVTQVEVILLLVTIAHTAFGLRIQQVVGLVPVYQS